MNHDNPKCEPRIERGTEVNDTNKTPDELGLALKEAVAGLKGTPESKLATFIVAAVSAIPGGVSFAAYDQAVAVARTLLERTAVPRGKA